MQSMTGYGRCQAVLDGREMTLEVKTVNHRFLDLSFRLPRNVGFLEEMLRRELTSGFQRGHMDVFVAYRNTRSDARQVRVDAALAVPIWRRHARCRRLPGRANRSAQHS